MARFAIGLTPCRIVTLLVVLAVVGCRSAPRSTAAGRYVVTAAPISIGLGPGGICVALDPLDEHGVWWWEPGASGCSTRSTGPGVFHADGASVSHSPDTGRISADFRIGTHSRTRPFVDVILAAENGEIQVRVAESTARVPIQHRNDLEVPEMLRQGRQ